ncbi:MAG: energy transducer TonB [Methyloversatilis sp.]|nr:energy transducer TonB [Methyloversatilis sp.]
MTLSSCVLVASCASVPQSCFDVRGTRENPPPVYPAASRILGQQGKTTLRVFVTAYGYPEVIEVHTSSGYGNLDQSAMDTMRKWCFSPVRTDGKPVDSWVLIPIVFRMEPRSSSPESP